MSLDDISISMAWDKVTYTLCIDALHFLVTGSLPVGGVGLGAGLVKKACCVSCRRCVDIIMVGMTDEGSLITPKGGVQDLSLRQGRSDTWGGAVYCWVASGRVVGYWRVPDLVRSSTWFRG